MSFTVNITNTRQFNIDLVQRQGPEGVSGTVQVGVVTTLPPNTPAVVENVGTSTAAVFNFGIPKGDTGEVSEAELAAALAALVAPLRPVVLTQPLAASGNVGDSLSISCLGGILPNTHLNLTYQWQLSTDAGVSYSNITGATSPSIPFNPALFGQNGLYRCRLGNAFGTQDTNAVALTIDNAIRHLYGVNDRGVAWDLDRMDHLFQGNTGVVPVSAYGDPVGLVLTRERGGLDSLGTELVANGSFDDASGWTVSNGVTITGGVASWPTNTLNGTLQTSNNPLIAGRMYRLNYTVSQQFSVALTFQDGTTALALQTTVGNHSLFFVAANTQIRFRNFSVATSGAIDNISIREVPGVHLVQPTSSRRPTYARRPKSGIRNLLQQSNTLSSAPWFPNNGTPPTLTGELWKINQTTANNTHGMQQTGIIPATGTFTLSFRAQAAEENIVIVSIDALGVCQFNLTTGANAITSGTGVSNISSVNLGGGVWACQLRITGNGAVRNMRIGQRVNTNFIGTAGHGLLIGRFQLEAGTSVTDFQVTTNQFDVTEEGQPSINYLWFDGIDDCLQSATAIDFSNSDEMTVCVGARTSGTTLQMLVEHAVNFSDSGAFAIFEQTAPSAIGARSQGSVVRSATSAANFPPGSVRLYTMQGKIGIDLLTLHVNQTLAAQSTDDQGTGNFANRTTNIGARNHLSPSLFFNGHLNSGFVINRILNPAILADYEKHWVAAKAGIDLP